MDIVDLKHIRRQLKKIDKGIIKRLQRWVFYVETQGLLETRKIPGFHDEPLKGKWKGYRSVRLNKKWRAIYLYKKHNPISIVIIEEVSPHEY